MSFTIQETELLFLGVATAGYLAGWAAYMLAFWKSSEVVGKAASALTWAAWGFHAASFSLRTFRAGHMPIYNAYEFTATFAGGIVLIHLVFERISRRRDLGVGILPVALALTFYAWTLSKAVEPLIPIFNGLWLKIHVITAFVAYSAFTATFGASCLYMVRGASSASSSSGSSGPSALDKVAYQAAALGFPFMTVCIVSGAIWAEYVWGRYWSWDPKETWSLITWLIFAAYLHTRYHRGWRERRAAMLAIVGFFTVLVTYFGVDLVMSRQHGFLFWKTP
jgi:cytochrome c-type biogenesis protein CcsB